jgi:hypothetical protein
MNKTFIAILCNAFNYAIRADVSKLITKGPLINVCSVITSTSGAELQA